MRTREGVGGGVGEKGYENPDKTGGPFMIYGTSCRIIHLWAVNSAVYASGTPARFHMTSSTSNENNEKFRSGKNPS